MRIFQGAHFEAWWERCQPFLCLYAPTIFCHLNYPISSFNNKNRNRMKVKVNQHQCFHMNENQSDFHLAPLWTTKSMSCVEYGQISMRFSQVRAWQTLVVVFFASFPFFFFWVIWFLIIDGGLTRKHITNKGLSKGLRSQEV